MGHFAGASWRENGFLMGHVGGMRFSVGPFPVVGGKRFLVGHLNCVSYKETSLR